MASEFTIVNSCYLFITEEPAKPAPSKNITPELAEYLCKIEAMSK